MKEFIILLFFPVLLQGQQIYPNLSGGALREAVATDYKPLFVLDYGEARDVMYGEIDNINDTVYCVYTGHALYLPQGVDPSIHLYMNASTNGINAEHTYPQSKGADEDNGNAHSDMHHIYPVRTGVNSARGNLPFANIEDNQTDNWYFKTEVTSNIPTVNKNSYSERKNGFFEPREDHKGNVARSIFYFYTMYKTEALEADPLFFEAQRETLCEWHLADPINDLEIDRTYQIAGYQNDLPNPFVIDETLAVRTYCTNYVVDVTNPQLDEALISIFPNPVSDFLKVEFSGTHDLILTDILGRKIYETRFNNQTSIDFSHFLKGTYMLHLEENTYKIIK